MEVGNITKAANFKSSLHLGYKNTQILFLWTVLFNTFMRQTLTDDFGGLHKNMNCAFPLTDPLFDKFFSITPFKIESPIKTQVFGG